MSMLASIKSSHGSNLTCPYDFSGIRPDQDIDVVCLEKKLYSSTGRWYCKNCITESATPPNTVWEWQLACPQCRIRYTTKSSMCSIMAKLNRRRILISGDSIQGHLSEDFASIVGATKLKPPGKPFPTDIEYLVLCNNEQVLNFTIGFLRDDLLESIHIPNITRMHVWRSNIARHRRVNLDWLNTNSIYDPQHDLLIFSTGPHHENKTRFMEIVNRLSNKLKLLNTSVPIIFRYSVGGHPLCTKFRTPISEIEYKSLWDKVMTNKKMKSVYVEKFRWHQQIWINEYISKTFDTLNVPLLNVDVENLSRCRVDAHRGNDCLHFTGASRSVYKYWVHMIHTYLLAYSNRMN